MRERLAEEVGLSVRGIEKNLVQLKSAGKIRRIGGHKGGRWEVVKGVLLWCLMVKCREVR